MKKQRNVFILSLIISTTALLLVLEGFWLRSSYENEYSQLRRELNYVFRSTLFEMHDSLIQKSILPLTGDSNVVFSRRRRSHHDTIQFISRDEPVQRRYPVVHDNIQIYISAPGGSDSIRSSFFRPLLSRIRGDSGQKAFSLRLRTDTLNLGDVEKKFRHELALAGIELPFTVKSETHLHRGDDGSHPRLSTDWVNGVNENRYMASFSSATPTILRKIMPQILFTAFLSSLTIASFIFLYRGIRSQQRLVEIKNDFISNVTHELKTPIATVSVALEALKNFRGIDNQQLRNEYLDIAQYELGRLSLLTDKVLTTSLFDEHGVKFEREPVDLEKTVEDILRSLRLVFEKRNASVQFEKEGTGFVVKGSLVHLPNVVYNLVDNALKYSPGIPDITIRLAEAGDKVFLSVADKGMGIPDEYQSRVFDKFFRVPAGDVHTVKGHGLGLSYVRKVVMAHDGEINVNSKPGEGSTFTITLPKAIA